MVPALGGGECGVSVVWRCGLEGCVLSDGACDGKLTLVEQRWCVWQRYLNPDAWQRGRQPLDDERLFG